MFGKLFNKSGDTPAPSAAQTVERAPVIDIQSLVGDDDALLSYLASESKHESRLLAARLVSDAGLSKLIQWARDHDRGVLREAKDRESVIERSNTVASAASALQDRVRALASAAEAGEAPAANLLADLDRDWAALDPAYIPAHVGVEYGRLRSELGDHSQQVSEKVRTWQLQVQQLNHAAQFLEAAWTAEGDPPYEVLAEAPAHAQGAELAAVEAEGSAKSIANALRTASARLTRAATRLDEDIAKARKRDEFIEGEASRTHGNIEKSRDRWIALPAPQRPGLATRQNTQLDAIFTAWQKARADRLDADKAARKAGIDRLKELSIALEKAVAEGHVKEAETHGREARKLLVNTENVPEGLSHDIARHLADASRLQGWQRWGAGVSREELVHEAEQMLASKLAHHLVVQEIKRLRERWQALDKDSAAPRPLWNRFDKALKAAYAPVKAHFDKEDERRRENQTAREAICADMQAVISAGLPRMGQTGYDWRPFANKIEGFVRRWRELGPAEHTLPKADRETLPAKFKALLDELEAPLAAERGFEKKRRAQLIEEAKTLGQKSAGTKTSDTKAPGRDGDRRGRPDRAPSLADQSRALMSKWQERAKAMPLSRHDENALWQQFKGALDAAFAAEKSKADAERASVNAETKAARDLIHKWEALAQSDDVAALREASNNAKREWNQLDKLPRDAERELRRKADTAIANLERQLKALRSGAWGGQVRALASCLVSRASAPLVADALPNELPAAWKEALLTGPTTATADALNDALKFELALQIPSPPEFDDARRRVQMTQLAEALKGGDRSTILDRKQLDAALIRLARASAEHGASARTQAILQKLAVTAPG